MFLRVVILLIYLSGILLINGADFFCPTKCKCLIGNSISCINSSLTEVPSNIGIQVDTLLLNDNRIHNFSFESMYKLSKLTTLNLDKNQLQRFPFVKKKLPLKTLTLRNNRVSSIPTGTFGYLHNLRNLYLDHNKFTAVTGDTFSNANRLTNLVLNNNRIRVLEVGSFSSTSKLTKLNLNHNLVQSLPAKVFSKLAWLQKLMLTNNSLSVIKDRQFSGLQSLEVLALSRNRIHSIQDGAFYGLNNLKELILSKNNLTLTKPQRFFGLNSLKKLFLRDNQITKLSKLMWNGLSKLELLSLAGNRIAYLPKDGFLGLKELNHLRLQKNLVRFVDKACFAPLKHLTNLDLQSNLLQWPQTTADQVLSSPTAKVHFLPSSLVWLDMSDNLLTSVPENAFSLARNLTTLMMKGNQISTFLADLEQLANLKFMTLNTKQMICDCAANKLHKFLGSKSRNQLKFKMKVKCSFPENLRGRKLRNLDSPLPCYSLTSPKILESPVNKYVLVGNATMLQCVASSPFKDTKIMWRRNNTLLAYSAAVATSTFDPKGHYLTSSLLEVKSPPRGQLDAMYFSCQAECETGRTVSRTVNVTVLESPKITLHSASPMNVRERSSFRIACEATGHPIPKITWSKIDGTFHAIEEERVLLSAGRTLIVHQVNQRDAGVYQCSASNDGGKVTQTVLVNVVGIPIFKHNFSVRTVVQLNHSLVITCPSANQILRPRWLFNGLPMPNETRNSLILHKIVRRHLGEYTCELQNSLGVARTSTLLVLDESNKYRLPFTAIIVVSLIACTLFTSLIWLVILLYLRRNRLGGKKKSSTSSSNISLYSNQLYKESSYTKVSRSDSDMDKAGQENIAERHDSGLYEGDSSVTHSHVSL